VGLASFPVLAEDWPTYSIVELALQADLIVSGKYLDKKDEVDRFLVRDFFNPGIAYDTLEVEGLKAYYNTYKEEFGRAGVDLEHADELIIYLTKNRDAGFSPVFSGFRLLKEGKVYTPLQSMKPGKFSFSPLEDSISWVELINNIKSAWTKVVLVEELNAIQDPGERNKALLEWTARNVQSFGNGCPLNQDCGWGSAEWEVFNWIAAAGLPEDTWAASILYRQYKHSWDSDDQTRLKIMKDPDGKSFRSFHGIPFLLSVTNGRGSNLNKIQALSFMRDAIDIFLYPISPGLGEAVDVFDLANQRVLRTGLLQYLDNDSLKTHAFKVITRLTNPNRFQPGQKDLVDMPFFITKYHEEVPSAFKNEIAKFIVSNTSEEDWKTISGNDKRILVFLEYPNIDRLKDELLFYVNQDHGKEKIGEHLTVILSHKDGTEIRIQNMECKSPYTETTQQITMDCHMLKSGRWTIQLEGFSGETSQFSWRSEYAMVVK
jgi:hypothetical protein